jgi:hypothetical protein
MDLADGRGVVCYFVLPLSADFGQCFRLEKFTCHGGQVDHVTRSDSHRDRHSDCPGHCYTGCGQHVLGLLALRAAGKLLPPVDLEEPCGRAFPDDVPDLHEGASYKPGHSSALPF